VKYFRKNAISRIPSMIILIIALYVSLFDENLMPLPMHTFWSISCTISKLAFIIYLN